MKTTHLSDAHYDAWARMRHGLWEQDDDGARADYARYKERRAKGISISFLAVDDDGRPFGFLDADLRSDFVEGSETSPVWYVEGIWLDPEYRGQGLGAALIATLEAHARAQGISEIASDCELDHSESEAFHKAVGFKEAIRSIHFIKKID